MIEGLVYFSPLLVAVIAVLILMFGEHEEDEQYRCFRFSRVMMLLSFALAVIFYNKPPITGLSDGSSFALVFELLLYAGGLALLYLSRKWFAAMHRLAYVYCGCLFITLLFGYLLISSYNLALTAICMIMICISNYILLKDSANQKETSLGTRLYLLLTCVCGAMLGGALALLYYRCGTLDYEVLRPYFELNKESAETYVLAAMLVVPFLFLLGLAPLHFCITESLGKAILPVFAYMMLMPTTAAWGGFIRFNVGVLAPVMPMFHLFYVAVALLSVGVGAVGACSGQNIRKIFAYASVYHLGIAFLTLRRLTPNAINASCVYLFAYLLAMFGICACLFGLKKKGEYLFMLGEFEGAAQKRPYISAMMVVFMFSLLGLPPFVGFLGLFSSLNYLALHHHYYQLLYLLITMLALGYAYLQIIKALCFEERKTSFDRADSGIYAAIWLNAALMFALILWPHYLMEDFRPLLETVFQ